ncbi:MAG: TldD/PmbA family protein [Clostridiaceae bacterium]|nr:TldD/PmbA family protein [Clostridiaceae bacterium]
MEHTIKFPPDLYADIRWEDVYSTRISYDNGILKQNKQKCDRGAFIRIYDGRRWYYSATTDLEQVQAELDGLAGMARPDPQIFSHPVIRRLEVNRDRLIRYTDQDIRHVPRADKLALLNAYLPVLEPFREVANSQAHYLDNHTLKHIVSSLGTDVTFDYQSCAVVIRYDLKVRDKQTQGMEYVMDQDFSRLSGQQDKFAASLKKDIDFAASAVPVVPGQYTCILAPIVTGVFAHESFGHKSEADFMIGDETMKREWALGSKVGSDILNIIDTGLIEGAGYVPFDDEGCRAKENYLIKNGVLTGRLHSSYTAAALDEQPTGNARAVNFEYEPIVRMTTTYIGGGNMTQEQLIADTPKGILIENLKHGSGMTTFTIAPSRAYMIRDGKVAEPVEISVITGNVMQTLHEIDAISDEVVYLSFPTGGCGKMEQYPLRVGFGGAYIRANGIQVQ